MKTKYEPQPFCYQCKGDRNKEIPAIRWNAIGMGQCADCSRRNDDFVRMRDWMNAHLKELLGKERERE